MSFEEGLTRICTDDADSEQATAKAECGWVRDEVEKRISPLRCAPVEMTSFWGCVEENRGDEIFASPYSCGKPGMEV